MLWLAALRTGERKYREHAGAWAEKLRPRVASESVFKGFLFWYGAALGAVLFGDAHAEALAQQGARGLVDMYDPSARLIPLGRQAEEASNVGTSEANIDALPGTVPLLLRSGGTMSAASEIARHHLARHVALCVRDDGSVCQSATFDGSTGALRRRYTHKGLHDDSTWGRAQAWGMLGIAQGIAGGAKELQPVAERLADWWIAHAPADRVGFWDFDDPSIPETNRDTSATAIAAAALLKLATLVPARRQEYHRFAEATVEALVSRHLTPLSRSDRRPPGILTDGCFDKRNGVATAHELVWGDYFLFEALLALDGTLAPENV
jgi:unsaturated chondroitin disaccharide hydrolase